MADTIEERACELAVYIIETGATVPALAEQVWEILQRNKAERHIRGGIATKKKYERKVQKPK